MGIIRKNMTNKLEELIKINDKIRIKDMYKDNNSIVFIRGKGKKNGN